MIKQSPFTCVTCLVSIKLLPIIHVPGKKELGVEVKQQLSATKTKTNYSALLQVYRRPILIRKLAGSVPASVYVLQFCTFFSISFLIAYRRGLIFCHICNCRLKKKCRQYNQVKNIVTFKINLVPIFLNFIFIKFEVMGIFTV